jgi:hypothetical protein
MPMSSVRLIPGVDTEKTYTLNEAGISTSAYVRFREGLVEKIGGWVKFIDIAVSGIPRALWAWQDFNETARLAVGTTTELDVLMDSGFIDTITPQLLISDFAPDFTTTNTSHTVAVDDPNATGVTIYDSIYFNTPVSVGGVILSGSYPISLVLGPTSYEIEALTAATATVLGGGDVPSFTTTSGNSVVTVTFPNHGLSAGGTITFPILTTISNINIIGTYTAVTIIDVNNFTIQTSQAASASTSVDMNGGDVQLVYYIALGPPVVGTGYGIGGYGTGGYGTGSTSGALVGDPITAIDWTLDNWGEILLACPKNGAIYYWQPTGGFENAQPIATGPIFNGGIFVAMPAQILVAWGSTVTQNIGVDQDPLQIRWSDQLDFNTWTPSTTNQAGSFRIPNGSRIVGGMQGPQFALIWTDLDLWAMQYLGFPLVFGFNKLGSGCGLIGTHAMAQLGSTIYWMGQSNFFALTSGGATPLPCTVWDAVFQNLDTANAYKSWAWANTPFNEVWFFYPSVNGNGECDSYAKVNVIEGAWDYGPMGRSAGIDQSVLGMPIATVASGIIYQHETGYSADGGPIPATFRTGYFAINDGDQISFIDWWIPDMKWNTFANQQTNATIQVTFYSIMYQGDTNVRTYGPYTLTNTTKFINPRIRGRFCAIEVSSSDIDSFFRMGLNHFRVAPDGRY